jgi:hypothetical protein
MEAIVFNTNFEIISFLDTFSSFIWTDRYQEYGDFELYLPMSQEYIEMLRAGYYIQNALSGHTMLIEKFEISTDSNDGSMLTVSGRSLESILDRRILEDTYNLNGTLEDCIAQLLYDCIISPSNSKRTIENFRFKVSGDSRIEAISVDTQYERGDNLYDTIEEICKDKDVGFQVYLDEDNDFVFQLYKGLDHTYEQDDRPYIVFSPDFDNLISSSYIEDYTEYKNVTVVDGEATSDTDDTPKTITVGTITGLDRRESYTSASGVTSKNDDDTTMSNSEYYALLEQKGNESLKEDLYSVECDGQMEAEVEYVYRNDFDMGDLVQVRNEWGIESNATITEFIMSQSDTGFEQYPTFTVNNDDDDD